MITFTLKKMNNPMRQFSPAIQKFYSIATTKICGSAQRLSILFLLALASSNLYGQTQPDLELVKTVATPTTKVVNGNTVPTAKPGDQVTFKKIGRAHV